MQSPINKNRSMRNQECRKRILDLVNGLLANLNGQQQTVRSVQDIDSSLLIYLYEKINQTELIGK